MPSHPLLTTTADSEVSINGFISSCVNLIDPKCSFSLLLINARSLNNKMHILRPLSVLADPDAIFVTETWFSPYASEEDYSLPDYQQFMQSRTHKRGGGCAIYVKNTYPAKMSEMMNAAEAMDSVWITADILGSTILFGCAYRPPDTSAKGDKALMDAFAQASTFPCDYKLVAGDFNLPELNWFSPAATTKYAALQACINLGGWTQHVSAPTREEHILDLIFTLSIPSTRVAVGREFPGSDHRLVHCSVYLKPHTAHPTEPGAVLVYRPMHLVNWTTFAVLVRSNNWDDFFMSDSVDRSAELFYEEILNCLDSLAPVSHLIRHSSKSMTQTKMHNRMRQLRRSYYKTFNFAHIMRANEMAYQFSARAKQQKTKQEIAALNSANKAKSLSWLLRSRTSNFGRKFSTLKISPNETSSDPRILCEAFSSHFKESQCLEISSTFQAMKVPGSQSLSFVQFDLSSVRSAISTTKPSWDPGPDGIPPSLLKNGGEDIPLLLLKIFTLSMQKGQCPAAWKHSIIVPRHKGGSLQEVGNYRPINHTSIISRVMEKLIKKALMTHLYAGEHINESQHGFLSARSCATCQLDFLNLVTEAIDSNQSVVILYLDMQKAFDRVPHMRLMHKLKAYGVEGPLLDWLGSYLIGRTQSVKVEQTISTPTAVPSGVVQGSVLGPTLFLIYINDLCKILQHGRSFIFADDVKVVYDFPRGNEFSAINSIREDLNALEKWCEHWQMTFSAQKSNVMTHRFSIPAGSLTINGSTIKQDIITTDLGLRYSMSLNFAEQVHYQVARVRGLSFHIRRYIENADARLELYKSHVRPHLEYCSFICSNLRKSDRVLLEKAQRRFTKMLTPPQQALNYRQRCEHLKIQPLWQRRIILNMCFLHKLIHRKLHSNITCLKLRSASESRLRNRGHSITPLKAKKRLRSRFFLVVYVNMWNRLPSRIREIQNLQVFRKEIQKFLCFGNLQSIFHICDSQDHFFETGPDVA
ncbi:unnamed protein product [Dicrocoelium dendriticum]|nr:unnamed protein product [Dicrocoelium dendriticum]